MVSINLINIFIQVSKFYTLSAYSEGKPFSVTMNIENGPMKNLKILKIGIYLTIFLHILTIFLQSSFKDSSKKGYFSKRRFLFKNLRELWPITFKDMKILLLLKMDNRQSNGFLAKNVQSFIATLQPFEN